MLHDIKEVYILMLAKRNWFQIVGGSKVFYNVWVVRGIIESLEDEAKAYGMLNE